MADRVLMQSSARRNPLIVDVPVAMAEIIAALCDMLLSPGTLILPERRRKG